MHGINRLARWVLSNPAIRTRLRDAYIQASSLSNSISAPDPVIPEITPFECVASEIATPRLNLFVPAISERHVFGGIATAVMLFERMAEKFQDARIVVTDEASAIAARQLFCAAWPICSIGGSDIRGRCIVVAGDRYGHKLQVRLSDRFVATAWWTAYAIQRIIRWQQERFAVPQRQFVYVIQDFEPCFYPWSTRYALAESTYSPSSQIVAVINTSTLADYITSQGFRFSSKYVFEPKLNRTLAAFISSSPVMQKRRRILVYGRPTVERNAFQLLMLGLIEWAGRYRGSEGWEVLSVGEAHGDLALPNGATIRSMGKQSLEGYAELLRTSAIGVSLMVSPHPSYPPLEMAAFGMHTITNVHANKDLSRSHPKIISLNPLTQDTLSLALSNLTAAFDNGSFSFNIDTADEGFTFPYLSDAEPFPFASEIVNDWPLHT